MTRGGALIRRLAAGLALTMLTAAVVLLLAGTVRNWFSVILALAGLFAATMSGWYIVSRHGTVRWLGLAVLAGSMALLAWGLLTADLRAVRAILTLFFAAASVGCARLALRRNRRASREGARTALAVPYPVHPVLIINPRSGGGKAVRFGLTYECERRGIVPVVLRPGDDLTQLAETAIAGGADVIGMAGGDGSQALVAAVAAAHGIPHVVIPAGTRNHFALDLGIDRDDVIGALDAFTGDTERRADLAEVNGRVFVNNVSLGIYARIVQSPEYRDAKLRTAAGMLPGFLGPGMRPLDLRFAGPDGTEHTTAHMILVSNNLYQLDHIGGRGTRERLDKGTLGVITARIDGPAQAELFAALEAVGQVRRFEGWLEWEIGRFEVRSAGPVEIGIDGEAITMDPPLVFVSRPAALRVRVARGTGRSPAAAAIHVASRSTVTELIAVAVGRRD